MSTREQALADTNVIWKLIFTMGFPIVAQYALAIVVELVERTVRREW